MSLFSRVQSSPALYSLWKADWKESRESSSQAICGREELDNLAALSSPVQPPARSAASSCSPSPDMTAKQLPRPASHLCLTSSPNVGGYGAPGALTALGTAGMLASGSFLAFTIASASREPSRLSMGSSAGPVSRPDAPRPPRDPASFERSFVSALTG
ncbi:hypothetical protein HYH03_013549 [Edaphochlamys debaryana]|uniref:Uncharacterized protein n=1 Tax=Edaphochlamys debaryana TaxID=47281 RepID=A0A835XMY5_9CHLO|nr:hypothetical protein HYH03_013549 [Edaphochlamys debaryana]|eukprot:KAG2487832.1 hypothetical protein HYH03_013549 [Edaphochlamys debaryana]